jgi:tRNA-dihydrouridine synthase A
MLGRAAYHDPAMLGQADQRLFNDSSEPVTPFDAVERFLPHIRAELGRGARLPQMIRPMLGLFHGRPGARAWRRTLTVDAIRPGAGVSVVERALDAIRGESARRSLEAA